MSEKNGGKNDIGKNIIPSPFEEKIWQVEVSIKQKKVNKRKKKFV